METIIYYILSALAMVVILTVHEVAHGYAALKLGDPTARNAGRLSLNPIHHIDPIGAIMMIVFHIGWAKPVPVNLRNMKNPRRDHVIVSLAGPFANLLLALISAFLHLLLTAVFRGVTFDSEFLFSLVSNLLLFIQIFHIMNIGIAVFNLIPIPPLDGSSLLGIILPPKAYFKVLKNSRYIYIGLVVWILLGRYLSMLLLSVPFIATNQILSFIAGLFSFSDLFGKIIAAISGWMVKLWQLIPFLKF